MQPSQSPSRRTSQVMSSPTIPTTIPHAGGTGQGTGDHPGPLRYPKALTAAELHLMLETEQEAMVNRLTKELSLLRQQTASVASTASSTSTTFNDPVDALHTLHSPPYAANTAHPTQSHRHRSSSNLSSYIPAVQGSRTGNVAGIAPARDSSIPGSRPSVDPPRANRSRAPSATSPHLSDRASPSQQNEHWSHPRPQRNLFQMTSPTGSVSRPEEVAHYRGDLESLKRENDALRKRVRDLEQVVRQCREQQATPTSESPVAAPAPATDTVDTSVAGSK